MVNHQMSDSYEEKDKKTYGKPSDSYEKRWEPSDSHEKRWETYGKPSDSYEKR